MKNTLISVSIDGKRLFSFKSLELKQAINEHHTFTLTLDPEISGKDRLHDLNDCTKWLGKTMTVHTGEDDEVIFVGIITNINLHKKESTLGCLVIKGYSTTYRLENAPSYHSWTDQTLASIVERLTTDAKVRAQINTEHKEEILYESQYNESDFGFIKRLSKQYGEWMYYDGRSLVFGKPKKEKAIALEYGTDLYTLDIGIQTLARPLKVLSYQARGDQAMAENSANRPDGQDELGYRAFNASMEMFKTPSVQTAMPRIRYVQQLTDYAKKRQESTAAESHYIVATSGNPLLTVGSVIEVKSSLLENFKGISTETLGEFIITEITHNVGEGNYYKNEFKAIPAGVRTLPEPDVTMPTAEPQMATVVRNDDPRGIGRVRVQMNWQTGNMSTSWIRVMTPDAGSSDNVNTNRGFVFIPEVGDKVLVGFRNGDPNRPYVMGSLFNGSTAAGGKVNNGIKSLTTRSGIEIRFDDNERSLHIKDASGNKVFLDGNGSVRIDALQNITLNAGKNMQLNVGKDLTVNVGNNQNTTIGNSSVMTVVQKLLVSTPFMEQVVAEFFHTQAGQALINSGNLIKIEAPETNVVGEEKLFMHSAKEAVVNSQGTMEMRGEQGIHEKNASEEYETTKEEIGTKVCVQFRTSKKYAGEYGFDWVRFADSKRTGDIEANRYDKIIGTCEGEGNNFKQDTGKYNQFLCEYKQQYIIPWKKTEETSQDSVTVKSKSKKNKKEDYLYVVPVMTLKKGQCADLVLNIDVNEKAKELKYEYDEDLFTLSSTTAKVLHKGTHRKADALKITCKEEFNEDKEIQLYAYDENDNKSLAGKFIVKANDDDHRYALNVVLVSVRTNLSSDVNSVGTSPSDNPSRKTTLEKYFAQCYIDANIEECEFDLTIPKRQRAFLAYADKGYLIEEFFDSKVIFSYLADEFNNDTATAKYEEYHKIFFINENIVGKGLYGQAHDIPSKEVIVLTPGLNDSTCAHELFHALGLYHSFSSLNIHTFEKFKTDNIMDYSDTAIVKIPVIATWQFQWKILHKNLKTVAQVKKEQELKELTDKKQKDDKTNSNFTHSPYDNKWM